MQQPHATVEIDMDAVTVPQTKDRLLGLQHELHDALNDDDFQERLCKCESKYGKGTLEFRKEHQKLVLEVQSAILPKYGFEASLQGVVDMLAAVKVFLNDPEVAANVKAIDALIWKPHHGFHHVHEHHAHTVVEPHHLNWLQRWEHQSAPHLDVVDDFDAMHAPVEIDMGELEVPLTKERVLGLQEELRKHFDAKAFQDRLRECELAHSPGTADFRKEHQKLALEVQAEVLPKYGFEGSMQGVHEMMMVVKAFSKDAAISANIKAIDELIWRPGTAPDAKAQAQKREI